MCNGGLLSQTVALTCTVCFATWQGSARMRDYATYIDTVGGIYSKRWGDANLRTFEACAFLTRRQVQQQ